MLEVREPSRRARRLGVVAGQTISTNYDPMIAKVVAAGATRDQALERLRPGLAETVYLGFPTNAGYPRRLLALPEVRAGDLHTGLIADHGEPPSPRCPVSTLWWLPRWSGSTGGCH